MHPRKRDTANRRQESGPFSCKEHPMHSIIYIVGAVVIVIALLSFVGLR